MVGNDCVKAGVAVGGVLNDPEPFEVKKRPKIVAVEMFCTGVTQLTVAVLETADPEVAWTASRSAVCSSVSESRYAGGIRDRTQGAGVRPCHRELHRGIGNDHTIRIF